MSRD
ncbi:hypothetical protein JMJ77_0001342 [Colletotrichum scovillei]|jgi:IK cytokine